MWVSWLKITSTRDLQFLGSATEVTVKSFF